MKARAKNNSELENIFYGCLRSPAMSVGVFNNACLLVASKVFTKAVKSLGLDEIFIPKEMKPYFRKAGVEIRRSGAVSLKVFKTVPPGVLGNGQAKINEDISFNKIFDDIEDTFFLSRFIWLVQWLLIHGPDGENVFLIERWLDDWRKAVGNNKNHPAWETYSCCDRVVNWIWVYCSLGEAPSLSEGFKRKLAELIKSNLERIIANPEYRANTNNHILNNARALYIGGKTLGLKDTEELGRQIFCAEAEKHIDSEGFLREGSSHYQLVLTKVVAEIAWFAYKSGDEAFFDYAVALAGKMIKASTYLTPEISSANNFDKIFPRIGDVSPDFPVGWFPPVPEAGTSLGCSWWDLIKKDTNFAGFVGRIQEKSDKSRVEKKIPARQEGVTVLYFKSGWVRAESKRYVFLAYCNADGAMRGATHEHNDFGSFFLYDKKSALPVIIDPGQPRYSTGRGHFDGRSARCHNTVLLNALPAYPETRLARLYPKKMLRAPQIKAETNTLTVKGFARAAGRQLPWQRRFNFQEHGISIEDSFDNIGDNVFDGFGRINIGNGYEFLEKKGDGFFLFGRDKNAPQLEIAFNGLERAELITTAYSPEYGKVMPARSIEFKSKISQSAPGFNMNIRLP